MCIQFLKTFPSKQQDMNSTVFNTSLKEKLESLNRTTRPLPDIPCKKISKIGGVELDKLDDCLRNLQHLSVKLKRRLFENILQNQQISPNTFPLCQSSIKNSCCHTC